MQSWRVLFGGSTEKPQAKETSHGDGGKRDRAADQGGHPGRRGHIRDLAGDGDHYAATVISESFRGKSRVQQHQIVYEALKGEMGGKLHALALQTGVPEG